MKNKTPSPSSASSSRRVTPVKVNKKPPVKRQLFESANNKARRKEREFQELLYKYGGNVENDPFGNDPNAFARARDAMGTGKYTKAQREALKTLSNSSPKTALFAGKLNKNKKNANVKYPNKATKKRARKLGINLTYIPNSIINGERNYYTEANILKKIANAEKAKAKANAEMPNLKKRAKALKVSLTKVRIPFKSVAKSANELKYNIANAEKAKVREERRTRFEQRKKNEKAAAKARAKAKREYEKMNSTKKWRNATRGFILKNKPKPKKKAAPKKKTKAAAPNAQNKRNRAYIAKEVRGIISRVKKAAAPPKKTKAAAPPKKRVAQKGKTKSSYDKNVRAYAKKLGIKTTYRVQQKEGQNRASGRFFKTNILEKKIRNRLAEQGNVANIANIRALIKGNLTSGNKNYIAKEVKGIINRLVAKDTANGKKRKAPATANTRKPKRFNPAVNIVAGMKENSEKKKAEEKRFLERLQQKQYEQYMREKSRKEKINANSAIRRTFGNNANMVRGMNQYGSGFTSR